MGKLDWWFWPLIAVIGFVSFSLHYFLGVTA